MLQQPNHSIGIVVLDGNMQQWLFVHQLIDIERCHHVQSIDDDERQLVAEQ